MDRNGEVERNERKEKSTGKVYVAKLRGLPWSATVEQVMEFLIDSVVRNGKQGVHMTFTREGKPSGEAFVEFDSEKDLEAALKKDQDYMGNRYIEVTKSDPTEMSETLRTCGYTGRGDDEGCVRLRGLPFNCTERDIAEFFEGLEIIPNGITIMTYYNGRKTGEAYVQFASKEMAEKALQKHREVIGHRYIEIFRSTIHEIMTANGSIGPDRRNAFNTSLRSGPYQLNDRFGGPNRGMKRGSKDQPTSLLDLQIEPPSSLDWGMNYNMGPCPPPMPPMVQPLFGIHMRGLPYKATQRDIADFFKPIIPVDIHILMDDTGRPSGEADVEFATMSDVQAAMKKDRNLMQHRYIELFRKTPPSMNSGPMGGSMRSRNW